MPHPHIPSREQADASLKRFYDHLGHRSLARGADAAPRLSGRPVHTDLGATVERLRRATPAAAIVRPIPPIRLRYRLARRRFIDASNRLLDAGITLAVVGIAGYVVVPAALAMITGRL